MALPQGLHTLNLAGFLLIGLGLLLDVVGIGTPEWAVGHETIPISVSISLGLFETCVLGICGSYGSAASTEIMVCQAFALMGFFAGLSSLFLSVYYVIKDRAGQTPTAKIPQTIVSNGVVTIIFTVLTAIIWSAAVVNQDTTSVGYSLVLAVIGSVLVCTGAFLIFLDARRHANYSNVR